MQEDRTKIFQKLSGFELKSTNLVKSRTYQTCFSKYHTIKVWKGEHYKISLFFKEKKMLAMAAISNKPNSIQKFTKDKIYDPHLLGLIGQFIDDLPRYGFLLESSAIKMNKMVHTSFNIFYTNEPIIFYEIFDNETNEDKLLGLGTHHIFNPYFSTSISIESIHDILPNILKNSPQKIIKSLFSFSAKGKRIKKYGGK